MPFSNINRRYEFLYYIDVLADIDKQRAIWINHQFPDGVEMDNLDLAIHFFFDDTGLADNTERQIGFILEDKKEAKLVKELTDIWGTIIDELGDISDSYYLDHPRWMEVINISVKIKSLSSFNEDYKL